MSAPNNHKRNRSNKGNFKHFNKRPKFEKKPFIRKPYQKREYRHQDQLKESDVGILEYINPHEGFSAIIKARFSDFQVNEINLDGQIAKLTDTKVPKDFLLTTPNLDYNGCDNSPITQIDKQTWEKLKNLADSTESADPITLNADDLGKDDRRKIHECVKSYFGQKIVVSTRNEDNKKFIEFKKYDKADKPDIRSCWPKDKGEYVHFLVYKEALDTMDVSLKISSCLRMSPSDFTYAGVKDKRAKTTQWFCVRKVEPWKLIMKTKFVRNIKVGNIEFKNEPLKIGQLRGNKFRIALRNVLGEDDVINKSMEHIKEHGFINYYGLQRFGNDKEVPTYSIGINLLLGNWEKAVDLILKPRTADDPESDISKAKKVYAETKDAEKALNELEKNKNVCIEAKLLEGISKNNENDYVNALEKIPRNTRLLYLHSFQSLIWNKMVSQRIALFGYKPVAGDLVLCNEDVSENAIQLIDKNIIVSDDESSTDIVDLDFKCKREVKVLTEEDVSQHSIFDIVLPLPGYDIVYPEHLKEHYKAALEEHGLSLEMTKQKVKTYNLCGDYRKILERVQDLSWKIMSYDDPTDNLIRSDFEELKGDPEPKSLEDGKYKALVTELTLTPSSYATMVLREILKSETSSSAQAKLNDYHETVQDEKKKIILKSDGNENNVEEEEEQKQSGSSLLANKEKYEEFKSNIFQTILENPTKREHDNENEGKVGTVSKKLKPETEDTAIKMEASLV